MRHRLDGQRFVLSVVVPPNTTVTVYLSAREVSDVREGGLPAKDAPPGIKFGHMQDGAAVFEVGFGQYEFTAPSDAAAQGGRAADP